MRGSEKLSFAMACEALVIRKKTSTLASGWDLGVTWSEAAIRTEADDLHVEHLCMNERELVEEHLGLGKRLGFDHQAGTRDIGPTPHLADAPACVEATDRLGFRFEMRRELRVGEIFGLAAGDR